MRKAVWGAIALGVFAFHFGSPLREISALRTLASVALLAGYLLLSYDPPNASPLQRKLLFAGIIASLASFLLTVTGAPFPLILVARVLAVTTVALPLWLAAGPAQFAFVAAGALALFTGIPSVANAGIYATSVHAYVAAGGAFWVAWTLHAPNVTLWERKPKRIVVTSNIVTLSSAEKEAALARIEKRYRDGEIPEHKYWDLRQEIESR